MIATVYAALHRPIAPGDPRPQAPDDPVPAPGPGPDPGPGDPPPVRASRWLEPIETVDALMRRFDGLY